MLGLTVEALLELASEGAIPGAILDARGWRFDRRGLEQCLARRGEPSGPAERLAATDSTEKQASDAERSEACQQSA